MQNKNATNNNEKFKDWEVGKDYRCVSLLGKGSYG